MGGHDVDRVQVLMADLAARGDVAGPGDQQRVGHAALVAGEPLPVREGRVERPRPAGGVVGIGVGPAELVDAGQVGLDGVGDVVEELVLVERAVGAALAAGPVVGGDDDDGVLQLPGLLQVVEQPPDLVVGVGDEPGVVLGHAGEQAPLVLAQGVPGPHEVQLGPRLPVGPGGLGLAVGVDRRQLGVGGQQPHSLLVLQDPGPDGLIALVEAALVAVGPLLPHVVGGVGAAGAEVRVEGLVRRHRLGVADELDRLVDQVGRQVVALLGRVGLLGEVVVVDQVGIPLVGLAAQEAVEPLEPPAQRPARLPGRQVDLVARGQVPLADRVGVPAPLVQDLGDGAVLEGDPGREPGEARRCLGDAGHVVGGRVAPGEQAGPGRGAQGGGVEVGVAQAAVGDPAHRRGLDRAAVHVHRPVAHVVPDDHQHVGRPFGRLGLQKRRPVRFGVANVDLDPTTPRRLRHTGVSLGQGGRPPPAGPSTAGTTLGTGG